MPGKVNVRDAEHGRLASPGHGVQALPLLEAVAELGIPESILEHAFVGGTKRLSAWLRVDVSSLSPLPRLTTLAKSPAIFPPLEPPVFFVAVPAPRAEIHRVTRLNTSQPRTPPVTSHSGSTTQRLAQYSG